MRNAFRDQVHALARRDERVVLLSGDIGNRMFDKFKAEFPDRFYNVGIAEQNIVGMAAGLAMAGLRPFVYTIATFTTYRVMEQIRLDLCYHHQPVVIAGVGGGLCYATLGSTHHTCEEVGMLRSLPGMTVFTPADPHEVRACVDASIHLTDGPAYIRLGKKGEPDVHAATPTVTPGKWLPISGTDGDADVTLLCSGHLLPEAVTAAETLRGEGHTVALWSCVTVKPLDTLVLERAFTGSPLVVTLEEHSRLGGFGGAVAEWLADRAFAEPAVRAKLLRLGTGDVFLHRTGSQDYARSVFGLNAEGLARSVRATLTIG